MRGPKTALSAWRRERAQADRPAIKRSLKKSSELAQGFCLTIFIILLGVVVVGMAVQVNYLATTSDEAWGLRETQAERLFVDYPGRVASIASLPFGAISFVVEEQGEGALFITETAPLPYMVRLLSFGGLGLAILFLGARFFGRIAREGSPFRRERARELGCIAGLIIVASFAPGLLMLASMAVGVALVGSDWALSYEFDLVNYALIVCGCLLLVFAKVFEYGCILQEQDDGLV